MTEATAGSICHGILLAFDVTANPICRWSTLKGKSNDEGPSFVNRPAAVASGLAGTG